MNCPNCGTSVPAKRALCPSCGADVRPPNARPSAARQVASGVFKALAFLILGPVVICAAFPLIGGIVSLFTPHPTDAPAPSPVVVTPPRPALRALVPTSQFRAQTWRFTTEVPADGWQRPGFDDRAWKQGPGPFGAFGPDASGAYRPPAAVVRTPWRTADIWLRRTAKLPPVAPAVPMFLVFHDEDVEIYLDGQLGAKASGYTVVYDALPIRPAARTRLKPGASVTRAVHCHQTGGGQEINVGIAQ